MSILINSQHHWSTPLTTDWISFSWFESHCQSSVTGKKSVSRRKVCLKASGLQSRIQSSFFQVNGRLVLPTGSLVLCTPMRWSCEKERTFYRQQINQQTSNMNACQAAVTIDSKATRFYRATKWAWSTGAFQGLLPLCLVHM